MRNGQRINYIEVQHKQQSGTDSLKQAKYDWVKAFEGLVAVESKPGRQVYDPQGQQHFTQEQYVFTGAFDDFDGTTTDMRVSFEGKFFQIVSVIPDYAKRSDYQIWTVLNS